MEKQISREEIYNGKVIHVVKDEVELDSAPCSRVGSFRASSSAILILRIFQRAAAHSMMPDTSPSGKTIWLRRLQP